MIYVKNKFSVFKIKYLTIGNQYDMIFKVVFMEIRKASLIIGRAGGNASKNAENYKISIPAKWVKEMCMSKEDKEIFLSFDGDKIIVLKKKKYEDFIKEKLTKNHVLKIFKFYENESLCTEICADYTDETVSFKNHTDKLLKKAFGEKDFVTWKEFFDFLESRCIPPSRAGIREYLEALGLCEYNPEEIIKITKGRMKEDSFYVLSEDLNGDYICDR